MKTTYFWMSCFVWAYEAASLRPDMKMSHDLSKGTLPSAMHKQIHYGLHTSIVTRLMDCPESLHIEKPTSKGTQAVTCSRASNCMVYGDCCWDVELPVNPKVDEPKTSCIAVHVSPLVTMSVYMITGCPTTWPEDGVREACEGVHAFNDTFYFTPTTSTRNLTYRNAFCAVCNNDSANATFWIPASFQNKIMVYTSLPYLVKSNPELHLRPCSEDRPIEACPRGTAEALTRKCKLYYAPVKHENNPEKPVYKNVYCALCTGADVFNLSCSPTILLPSPAYGVVPAMQRPSLAALFRPVVSTPNCYALYDGHCYIARGEPISSAKHLSHGYIEGVTETVSAKRWPLVTYKPKRPDYSSLQNYVTLVCTSLSICFLALKVVVFGAYSDARSGSSTCTLCLSSTLLITQVLFLLTKGVDLSEDTCYAGAVFVHYSFLCTFFWTCVLSFDIWRSLTTVSANSSRSTPLANYGLFAWGSPMAVIAIALAVDQTAPESALSPGYGETACFICTFWGQVLYFQLPMASLVLFCLFMYLSTVCYIRSTSSAVQGPSGGSVSGEKDGAKDGQQRGCIGLYVSLALVMGLPWALVLIGAFAESAVLDTIVNVMVGSQGVYLFFIFRDYRYIWSSVLKVWKWTAPKTEA